MRNFKLPETNWEKNKNNSEILKFCSELISKPENNHSSL